MSQNGETTPDQLSSPRIPEQSPGSSISTSMQQEYDELLKYTVVIPQFDPKIGPQILENAKGLFMTTEFQLKFKQHLEQQKLVCAKFENKLNDTGVNDEKEGADEVANKTQEDTLDGMSNSINSNTTLTDSFSPKKIGLLRPVNNSNIYYNLDTNFTTITNEELTNDSINDSQINQIQFLMANHQQNQSDGNNNLNLNINTNNNNNDINPRKHSPVPISPPTNIDYDGTTDNSMEILQNNLHQKTLKQHHQHQHQRNHHFNDKTKNDFKMTNSLDKWFKEFKVHVISELERSRLQIMKQQQERLLEEKEKQATEILKLQKEIELMRESLNEHEKNTERKDSVIANLSKALDKQREKAEAQRVMMEWKIKRLENSREAFTAKIAENFHDYRTKSKVFLNWHSLFITRHKIKVEKACKKKAEEVCLELASQYQEKIKKLDEELKRSKEEIDRYKIEMSRCEENMKRALMRGVCALNLEAMSIFTDDLSNTNTNNNKRTFNMHNNLHNSNTYYSDEDLDKNKLNIDFSNLLNSNQQQQNSNSEIIINQDINQSEQLFKSSFNNINNNNNDQLKGVSFNKKLNEINNYKNITINCENKQVNATNATCSSSKIPTIIIENNKTNEQIENKSRLSTQQRSTNNLAKPNVKAKVNSNVNATFPYRSIIIEKHTKTNDDLNKVYKYLPTTTTATTSVTAPSSTGNVSKQLLTNAKKNLLIKCSN